MHFLHPTWIIAGKLLVIWWGILKVATKLRLYDLFHLYSSIASEGFNLLHEMFQLGVVENMLRLIQLIINREGYHRHIHFTLCNLRCSCWKCEQAQKILISSASTSIRTAVKANAVVEAFFSAPLKLFLWSSFRNSSRSE